MAGGTRVTPEKEDAIIAALELHPSKARACRSAKVVRRTFYRHLATNPDFKARVDAAQELGIDAVEDALFTDAINHDTTAAIFTLKTWRRSRYGDKTQIEHTGVNGEPIRVIVDHALPVESP